MITISINGCVVVALSIVGQIVPGFIIGFSLLFPVIATMICNHID